MFSPFVMQILSKIIFLNFSFICFKKEYNYNIVLVSDVQFNESSKYICISPLSWTYLPSLTSHPSRSSQLAEFPVLYNRSPLVICFTHGSVYMSILISQFIPPSLFHSLFLNLHILNHEIDFKIGNRFMTIINITQKAKRCKLHFLSSKVFCFTRSQSVPVCMSRILSPLLCLLVILSF